jgi:membrane fusion protein (multidrug efflux system)
LMNRLSEEEGGVMPYRKWLKFGLVALGLGLSFIACSQKAPEKTEGTATAAEKKAVPVSVATITTGEFVRTVTATGTIQPRHEAVINAGVSGQVEKVHVEVGDKVTKGRILVEIDPELFLAQAEQAQAAYQKAKTDLERNEKLFATRDISETILEAARLQEKSALVAMKQAEKQLHDARIPSPFDGWVAARPVQLGSTIAPGMAVITVVDISQIRVELGVSEEDVTHLRVGQPVKLTVGVYRGREFTGRITAVGPQADANSRLFPVEVTATNPPGLPLRAGMVARAEIEFERLKNAPLLPQDAITQREGETIVFTVENNTAMRRVPKLGAKQGGFYLIHEGLQAGEVVVIAGQEGLREGTAVEIQQ